MTRINDIFKTFAVKMRLNNKSTTNHSVRPSKRNAVMEFDGDGKWFRAKIRIVLH